MIDREDVEMLPLQETGFLAPMLAAVVFTSACGATRHTAAPEAGLACEGLPMGDEPVWAQLSFDGGVPIEQVALASAIAQCSYWSRCTPIAPYVLEQCAQSLLRSNLWNLTVCTSQTCVRLDFDYLPTLPDPVLLQRVDAGLVGYDPQQEQRCLESSLEAPCTGDYLVSESPECFGAFYLRGDAGTSDASVEVPCWPLECLFDAGFAPVFPSPCLSNADCVMEEGGLEAPYCVNGFCSDSSCKFQSVGACPSFVDANQPCDSDPPFLGVSAFELSDGGTPSAVCDPGLTCRGLGIDGGLGVCAQPQDVGGPCIEGVSSGCMIGLVCACGQCRIPPTEGPCVSSKCKYGVTFCDTGGMCTAAAGVGEPCANAVCALSLQCTCLNPQCGGGGATCQ